MATRPTTREAYALLQAGAECLAIVEGNGIKIDEDYLRRTIKKTAAQIEDLQKELQVDRVWGLWQKEFGDRANLGSATQLGKILYDVLGLPCKSWTVTERPSTDQQALERVDLPFVKQYLRLKKYQKVKAVYLDGLLREVVDGFFHPTINLHTAVTFRSSAGSNKEDVMSVRELNLQNLPIRNPEFSETVRSAFIPRHADWCFGEGDLSNAEVRVAAAITGDPVLIDYVKHSPPKDMHRDMAMQLFFLKEHEVGKKTTRDVTKSNFVFAEFYGSVAFQVAERIWNVLERNDWQVEGSNDTVLQRLRKHGIRELGDCDPEKQPPRKGTFEAHCKKVEDDFWRNRFKVYAQWKYDWYDAYCQQGYFDMPTGFRVEGYYKRNEVNNSPIQGCSFHCLLWIMIHLQKWLTKYKMKTKLLGEVHDSIIFEGAKGELQDCVNKMYELVTRDLPKAWSWLGDVPMEMELDVSPPGKSWYEKRPWVRGEDGVWKEKVK